MHGLMPDLMPGLMPDLMLILMPGGLMTKPAGATTYPAGIRGQTHGQITGTHSRSHKPREPTTHPRDLHDDKGLRSRNLRLHGAFTWRYFRFIIIGQFFFTFSHFHKTVHFLKV